AAEPWIPHALTADNEIDFIPPPSPYRPPVDLHSGFLRRAVDRLKVEEVAGARFHHPDHHLAVQVEDLGRRVLLTPCQQQVGVGLSGLRYRDGTGSLVVR
ncbi:hypothetical protein, partial [Streptomyces sp. WM6386]|uniref:hypothetical protein n=1 Tax=Streptomyces sp. WM6386 TaxID=1415558 RepID=UPI000619A37E